MNFILKAIAAIKRFFSRKNTIVVAATTDYNAVKDAVNKPVE